MTTTETATFTQTATYLAQSATRRVADGRRALGERSAAEAAKWVMRDLVVAETEQELYAAATNTDRGEARFVDAVRRYLGAGARSTDAFDRAAAETQAEAALRALRNLRSTMSDAAKLALVNDL